MNFTTVIGVDRKHLNQLHWTYPTWKKHKPSLLESPMIVFHDRHQVTEEQVLDIVDHPNLTVYPWPPSDEIEYHGDPDNKWYHPQRYKMLAGFVYVPAYLVHTPYWLKLDTDVVATGKPDWIKPSWMDGKNEIISHRWNYTKPPDQFMILDDWVSRNQSKLSILSEESPLNMVPKPGADTIGHARIISWCAFFGTTFTKWAAEQAASTCGQYMLPVPSQDGFLWYLAKRMGMRIVRENMKSRGWMQWSTYANVRKNALEAMK